MRSRYAARDRAGGYRRRRDRGFDAVALAWPVRARTSGLIARASPVVIPRVHDCLTLFLGSREGIAGNSAAIRAPNTFPGWFTHKLGVIRRPPALWSHDPPNTPAGQSSPSATAGSRRRNHQFLGSWKRNYTRVAVIDTGCGEVEGCLRMAERISAGLGWECARLPGNTAMLRDLVSGEWDPARYLVLRPGERSELSGDEQVLVAVSAGTGTVADESATEAVIGDRALSAIEEPGARSGLGLGIDAGGTYTDAVVCDFATARVLSKAKALTTYDPLIGISGTRSIGTEPARPREPGRAVHQLATNAIVRNAAASGCIIMPYDGFDETLIRWPQRADRRTHEHHRRRDRASLRRRGLPRGGADDAGGGGGQLCDLRLRQHPQSRA